MIVYNEKLKVTQEEFDTCQEEIKNVIRKQVDKIKTDLLNTFPVTGVEFLVSMKGETLQSQYGFLFKKTTKEDGEVVFAKLFVDIEIVEPLNNIE